MGIQKLNLDSNYHILVTGGAGFIGSNICKALLENGNQVRVLDNLATGQIKNIEPILEHPNFNFIQGDIRDLDICREACNEIDYVLHQAALGSVPRSINDPITSNAVNVSGFLNMLVACRDAKVKRFIYAASSSTYGDSETLPKVEDKIGKPLSPYAITKYVNELYADVFGKTYNMETIGLRYFNVFGRHQDPNGAYAAVIPKFVLSFMNHESPIINGDGSYSRDFTYIDNVIEANIRAILASKPKSTNTVYNVAYGERTTLNELVVLVKNYLAEFDPKIGEIEIEYGQIRAGDVPHSLASIEKARKLLNYNPEFDMKTGLKEAVKWYWKNLER
ncbi:SDR family oxidoreductase [Maribacter algarum]|uniref:SDR family oxidoreductase n=1 Tax=Maribacter algarum (ex Zhang et al. 2020) TaxID=2578118 RepID=A0A5S3PHM5_9FLAO|nr:SDR family oxidoreductase [Maribacter algarum]TMM53780.1 SDR family oxidoreductase [Maribacter algarum]